MLLNLFIQNADLFDVELAAQPVFSLNEIAIDYISRMNLLTQKATLGRDNSNLGVCCVQELGETLRREDDRGFSRKSSASTAFMYLVPLLIRTSVMDSSTSPSPGQPDTPSRGRGGNRGRGNRGGLGKYLRARGRKGTGRPAEWKQRLLLEGEEPGGENNEEVKEAKEEMIRKYAKRQLGSNADRYGEEGPELNSEGAFYCRLPPTNDRN